MEQRAARIAFRRSQAMMVGVAAPVVGAAVSIGARSTRPLQIGVALTVVFLIAMFLVLGVAAA